jgi:hypothetical protein
MKALHSLIYALLCCSAYGAPQITSLTLINASTGAKTPLVNGAALKPGAKYYVRATANNDTESVRFQFDATLQPVENLGPYDSVPGIPPAGGHVILVTPYPRDNAKGKPGPVAKRTFSVSAPSPSPTPTPTPALVSATVVWPASAGATGYVVVWGTGSRTYTQEFDCGNELLARLVGKFTPGTTYYIAVKAYNAAGTSAPSPEVSYSP